MFTKTFKVHWLYYKQTINFMFFALHEHYANKLLNNLNLNLGCNFNVLGIIKTDDFYLKLLCMAKFVEIFGVYKGMFVEINLNKTYDYMNSNIILS